MPYTPGGIADIASQIRNSVISGNEAVTADTAMLHAKAHAGTQKIVQSGDF